MKGAIDAQIAANDGLNLLYEHIDDIARVDEHFVDAFKDIRSNPPAEVEKLISYTVEKTISKIYEINQFLHVTPALRGELFAIYKETWRKFDPDRSLPIMRDHHRRLSEWVGKLYPPRFVEILRSSERIGKVINEQYSVLFQIKVLGLNIKEIAEPIIDIGCGPHGGLVRYLYNRGKNVYGIDRTIKSKDSRLKQADWLEFEFKRRHYGTIIANMSFSNHFVFHLQHQTESRDQYFNKFGEILESLSPGGMFVYAPAVPEIEARVDLHKYSFESTEINSGGTVTKIHRFAG